MACARFRGSVTLGHVVVFECRRCRARLSAPVLLGALPKEAATPDAMAAGVACPPRMAPGTYAVDDEPFGPPYVPAGDGRYHVADGPRRTFVLAPDDVVGTAPGDPARRVGCCGPDGMDGPNLKCARCGAPVGTEVADCWTWQEIRLYPDAVHAATRPTGATP